MLKVKRLSPDATLPTVGHPGEDLGYDLYASEGVFLIPGQVTPVKTGIALRFELTGRVFGLTVEDRSSMAIKGIYKSAGIIDAGYVGELKVLLTATRDSHMIHIGDKIAQVIPREVLTRGEIVEVDELAQSSRGTGGFGSTGV